MRKYLSFVRSALVSAAILCAGASVHAHDDDHFVHKLDTTTLASLKQGANLKGFFDKKFAILVRLDRAPSALAGDSSIAEGVLIGFYPTGQGRVDLKIHLTVKGGLIESALAVRDVDAAIYAWQGRSKVPAVLKDLKPQTKSLLFDSEVGFRWEVGLQRKFSYVLFLDEPYDGKSKTIVDRSSDVRSLKNFVGQAESDGRGRLILGNNTSGLPAIVGLSLDGTAPEFSIHHPLHDIVFVPELKLWKYRYAGPVAVFEKLPEVRRSLQNADVKSFLVENVEGVRVTVEGDAKSYFDCTYSNDVGKRVRVRVDPKKVTLLPR